MRNLSFHPRVTSHEKRGHEENEIIHYKSIYIYIESRSDEDDELSPQLSTTIISLISAFCGGCGKEIIYPVSSHFWLASVGFRH